LRIVVVEREFAGFGASGRNGGQLTGGLEYNREKYAKARGREAVVAMERALRETVDEVIAVAAGEGIDADIVKGGILRVATNPAQWSRARHEQRIGEGWGVAPDEAVLLDRDATLGRVRVAGALGSRFQPGAARIQPAKLARGLAEAVERLGVSIYERTAVTELRPAQVVTATGSVRAPLIVRATEGFTPQLPGLRRSWLPMNSAMIVTDPLPNRL
jgi:glycine/D-amino acid oxidase-like deaminating enzyme